MQMHKITLVVYVKGDESQAKTLAYWLSEILIGLEIQKANRADEDFQEDIPAFAVSPVAIEPANPLLDDDAQTALNFFEG